MLDSHESELVTLSERMATKRTKPVEKTKSRETIPGQTDRLVRLRTAFGFNTAVAFSAFLDISNTRYGHFENGAPLSREVAFLIVQRIPGVSLDWLYFGKTEALPLELARRLGELPPGKRSS